MWDATKSVPMNERECVVYWYSFSNPRTRCETISRSSMYKAGEGGQRAQKKEVTWPGEGTSAVEGVIFPFTEVVAVVRPNFFARPAPFVIYPITLHTAQSVRETRKAARSTLR